MRFVVTLSLLLGACNTPPPARVPGTMVPGGEPGLIVNGTAVPMEHIQLAAKAMNVPLEDGGPMVSQFVDSIGITTVLYDQAVEQKLYEDPEIQKQLAMAERQALAQAVMLKKVDESVTDASIQEWYDTRKVQFAKPQAKARHILVKEESKAKELLAQITGGADFAALAAEHSTDPGSGKNGGDLGWFDERRMVKPFAEAAFAAEVGEVIGPVESRFGFHIIEVQDKRAATPLEDVKPQAEEAIKRETMQGLVEEIKSGWKMERKGILEGTEPPAPAGPPPGAIPVPGAPPAPAAPDHGKDDGHGH